MYGQTNWAPGYTVQVGKHIDTIAGSNAISVDERAGIKAETAKVN